MSHALARRISMQALGIAMLAVVGLAASLVLS
jgi:hypothetical protein